MSKGNENSNSKRCLHCHIHRRIFYNSQNMETTLVPVDRRMDKEFVIHMRACTHTHTHTHVGTVEYYSAVKNQGSPTICDNMDGPCRHAR